jgi:hypothetical protein
MFREIWTGFGASAATEASQRAASLAIIVLVPLGLLSV